MSETSNTPPPTATPSTPEPRPDYKNAHVRTRAAAALAPKVINWDKGSFDEEDSLADVTDVLSKSFRVHMTDGYELAKELEDDLGIEPDEDLVNILSEAHSILYQETAEETRKWMKTAGLTAPEIGARVVDSNKPEHGIGKVVTNAEDIGKSTVSFPSQGHVTEQGQHGVIGNVLPWEQLVVAPPETQPA